MQNVKFLVDASSRFFEKNNVNLSLLLYIFQELMEDRITLLEIPHKYRTLISVFLFSLVEHQLQNGDLDDEKA